VSLSDFLSASTALLLSHLQCSITILIDSAGIPSSLTGSFDSGAFYSYFSSTYLVLIFTNYITLIEQDYQLPSYQFDQLDHVLLLHQKQCMNYQHLLI
jgi:hypothetical protein